MKITDLALIFVGVTLPLIILVYVNVSFTIKAFEQEMYYQKLVNSALSDATLRMKEVESEDPENDYGYSGKENNKLSINANIAINTFLNSLYNNFNVEGNEAAERYLQVFIPAIAVIDYNGVYISSIENYTKDGVLTTAHTIKPKRYYSYTYGLTNDGTIMTDINNASVTSRHTIEFTMDDYITHRCEEYITGSWRKDKPVKSFYISDDANNNDLVSNVALANQAAAKVNVVKHLQDNRKKIIVDTISKEMAYATNNNNFYARNLGVTYNFVFPETTYEEMYKYVENIGIMAFVQGLSIGNKYLNYKAYGVARLELANKYYISIPSADSKYKMNLYHKDARCPEYKIAINKNITPEYVLTKQQAASLKATFTDAVGFNIMKEGFYPCPICRP